MDDKNLQKPQTATPAEDPQPEVSVGSPPEKAGSTQNPIGANMTIPSQEIEPSTQAPVTPSSFNPSGTSVPTPAQSMPGIAPKKKKGKVWIIILAVLIVLLGGVAAAYQFWYQNPDKVVTDAMIHALTADTTAYTGTVSAGSQSMKIKANIDGVYDMGAQNVNADITFSFGNINYSVKGSVLFDKNNNLFIKIANLDTIVAPVRLSIPAAQQSTFDDLVGKINNTWIKISPEELATYSEPYSRTQTCINNAVQQTENHASLQQEIRDIYKDNHFITVGENLGDRDGSMGYVLTLNTDTMKTFAAKLKDTQAYKTLHDCDASFTIDENNLFGKPAENGTTIRTELWVSRFAHQVTEFSTKLTWPSNEGETSLDLKPVYNSSVSVIAPDKFTTLKDIQRDVENLQRSFLPATSEQDAAMGL